jgi:acetyl-CoA acetyltransferase
MAQLRLQPRDAAIVGVAESDDFGQAPGKTAIQLAAQAARNALDDAGIAMREVDGVFTCGIGYMPTLELCEFLGIQPRHFDSTQVGGSSFVVDVEHARAAIHAGLCEVALIAHGEHGFSQRTLPGSFRPSAPPWSQTGQFTSPFGIGTPTSAYAMAAARHMAVYGTTGEQLAEVAVATRKWAQLNPRAMMRTPLTVDEVMASPYIAYPFHRADICLVTDAAGAVIVTTPERARSLRKPPVWVLGTGAHQTHRDMVAMPDYTVTPAKHSGAEAFAAAGVRHDEIDLAMIYDSFTYTVIASLESLGFCRPGEGGAFVSGQRTAPGGDFPMNTNGGGLSYTHPGMYGIFTLIEATRQLRGECEDRQVAGARLALCNGTGGYLSSTGTAILASD